MMEPSEKRQLGEILKRRNVVFAYELMDLFRTNDIDLVALNDAPPLLAHRILKEGLLFWCANDKTRLDYKVKAVLKYLDWKPYLDKDRQRVFGSDEV